MDKDYILDNVEDFSADQLCDFIKTKLITLDELRKTGDLDASKRKAIQVCLNQDITEDDDAWSKAMSQGTEAAYGNYLERFSNGRYVAEANKALDRLEQQRIAENTERNRILHAIRKNPNAYPPDMI